MTGPIRLSVGATAVFGTRTLGLLTAATTTFVLARLLATADLGAYFLLALIAPSMLALLSWGIPAALTYHAGRGEDLNSIRTLALVLAGVLSAVVVGLLVALGPFLGESVLRAAPIQLIPVAALGVPAAFVSSFCGSVILGRQNLRAYNMLLGGQGIAMLVGQVLIVGVADQGLPGAIATYVVVTTTMACAAVVLMIRLAPFAVHLDALLAPRLVRFGFILHPASLAGFFSYRADVFLMSALLNDPSALGIYGLAVSVAELCFYVPDAISTVLFPRVAGSSRLDAAVLVPAVSRTALALTGTAAIGVAIVAAVGFPLVFPSYARSVLPTLILLPGVVALSASKVLSGYLSGIGRPGPISAVATTTLILNLALNVVLIPILGPAGAALASLCSYWANGSMMVILGAREAGVSLAGMVVPRRADVANLRRLIMYPLRPRSSS